MSESALLVMVSCPESAAATLADALVQRRLAACVSILPGMRSVYRWQGRIETAQECLLLAKTTALRYAELEAAVRSLHPYDLPEILAVEVARGLPGYLRWLEDSTA
jgi:periplasmic divalent cation tolerance protein